MLVKIKCNFDTGHGSVPSNIVRKSATLLFEITKVLGQTVKIIDLDGGKDLKHNKFQSSYILTLCFSPDELSAVEKCFTKNCKSYILL